MKGNGGAGRSRGDHSRLQEISIDTKRIYQMINSLSQSTSFERRSGDLSADLLLKGALDLQESLVMLEKLQRSSDFQGYGYSKRKCPGSPETCTEIKTVIRESLYRKHQQNNDGKARDFTPVEQKKPRAPNLIARLMGLEEPPPKVLDPRKKYLNEIIENMKLKGLLGDTLIPRRNRNARILEEPPIVVIKPAIKRAPLFEFPPLEKKLEVDHKSEKPRSLNRRNKRSETKPVDEWERPVKEEREIFIHHDQASTSPITRGEAEKLCERSLGFSRPAREVIYNLDRRECCELDRESTAAVEIVGGSGEENEREFLRRLERDLRGNDGGAWNSGWAEMPANEEARELVRQLENHLFNLLVIEFTRV